MQSTATPLHLAATFDENFVSQFYVLASSVLTHNSASKLHFHVIATGLSADVQAAIERFINMRGAHITFYAFDPSQVASFPANLSHVTLSTYYRLFLPLLIPEAITRLLYLDTDIVVINDLRELYDTPLGAFPVAAVNDMGIPPRPELGLEGKGNYFNAGVLLMNIPEWKNQRVTERAFQTIADIPTLLRFVDQDALNVTLHNNWLKLDMRYNLMLGDIPGLANKAMRDYLRDKVIIHYTTIEKPWKRSCANRLKFLYREELRKIAHLPQQLEGFPLTGSNLMSYLKNKAIDFYFELPWLMKLWRSVRQ